MIENFNDNFRELCLNLKIDERKFILGLSGGIDSMALLSLLKRFIVSNKSLKIEVWLDFKIRSMRNGQGKI